MTTRVALLISGRGSNMAALIDAMQRGTVDGAPVLVVSNIADAGGLGVAAEKGVPTAVVSHRGKAREAFEAELQAVLEEAAAEFICLAGFMRVLSPDFVRRWEGRMINIHPSLLPLFRGLHVHEQALAAGVTVSGCTVHEVTPDLDAGPIIGQAVVPVMPGDDAESLSARVQKAEHVLYPAALARCLGAAPRPVSDGLLLSLR